MPRLDAHLSCTCCVVHQVYLAYQAQLNFPVADLNDMEQKVYYNMEVLPNVALFMCDVRLQRSLHRAQQKDADWTNKEYMGPRQWEELEVRRRPFQWCFFKACCSFCWHVIRGQQC